MRTLDLDDLDRERDAFDRAVAVTDGIDRYCSSTDWVIPAARALMPPGRPHIVAEGDRYAAFTVRGHDGRRVLEPLELSWGLASPVAGGEPDALADLAARALGAAAWDVAVIAGVERSSPLFAALVGRLSRHRVGLAPPTVRHRASLAGGIDGFLARRSREVRKALRRAAARAAAAGVEFEHHRPTAAAAELYRRILAIEARGWKGLMQTGLADPAMRAFYADMIARLTARGAARVTFARLGGRDVGFVLGARVGDLYRGLQFGFAEEARALSLGNLGQLRVIEQLCGEGVLVYDLGTGGDYKLRWAEAVLETETLIVTARSP